MKLMEYKYDFRYLCIIIVLIVGLTKILPAQSAYSGIRISEIMFYPATGNNEFVEIFNTSINKAEDIRGVKVKYYNSAADSIIAFGKDYILPPLSYALIFEGDFDTSSGIYNIPEGVLLFRIDDNSFGSSGMANTYGRPLTLLRRNDDTLDTYTYSADNEESISDEIVSVWETPGIWKNSVVKNGTPGKKNSVSPRQKDIGITQFSITPYDPVITLPFEIKFRMSNAGTDTALSITVSLFYNMESDTERIDIQNFSIEKLCPGDSSSFGYSFHIDNPGSYTFTLTAIFSGDEYIENNHEEITVVVSPAPEKYNDIIITEFMYYPLDDCSEWLEIFNRSSSEINLKNWTIADRTSRELITGSDYFIAPDEYCLLSHDLGILSQYGTNSEIIVLDLPSLNNSGDIISIYDSRGFMIDSLEYISSWGGNRQGRSLERIDYSGESAQSSNWAISLDASGATPGRKNSIYAAGMTDQSLLQISPNPFSPDQDGYEDEIQLTYSLDERTVKLRIRVFDSRGRLVKTLMDNYSSGSHGAFIYDGKDESGHFLRMGIYILLLEALDINNSVIHKIKKAFVSARKL